MKTPEADTNLAYVDSHSEMASGLPYLSTSEICRSRGDTQWGLAVDAEELGYGQTALMHYEAAKRAYLETILYHQFGRADLGQPGDIPLDFTFYLKLASTQTRLALDPALKPYEDKRFDRRDCLFEAAATSYDFALNALPHDEDNSTVTAAESVVFMQRADMYLQRGRLARAREDLVMANSRILDTEEPLEMITDRLETQKHLVAATEAGRNRLDQMHDSAVFLARVVASKELEVPAIEL